MREKRWESPYRDWFHINFDGNSAYNDGFWYEGWEGHYELVKLNLRNPAVRDYLVDTIKYWIDEFDIDGLRLDVAYSLEPDFIRQLRWFSDNCGREFFLLGETRRLQPMGRKRAFALLHELRVLQGPLVGAELL